MIYAALGVSPLKVTLILEAPLLSSAGEIITAYVPVQQIIFNSNLSRRLQLGLDVMALFVMLRHVIVVMVMLQSDAEAY